MSVHNVTDPTDLRTALGVMACCWTFLFFPYMHELLYYKTRMKPMEVGFKVKAQALALKLSEQMFSILLQFQSELFLKKWGG